MSNLCQFFDCGGSGSGGGGGGGFALPPIYILDYSSYLTGYRGGTFYDTANDILYFGMARLNSDPRVVNLYIRKHIINPTTFSVTASNIDSASVYAEMYHTPYNILCAPVTDGSNYQIAVCMHYKTTSPISMILLREDGNTASYDCNENYYPYTSLIYNYNLKTFVIKDYNTYKKYDYGSNSWINASSSDYANSYRWFEGSSLSNFAPYDPNVKYIKEYRRSFDNSQGSLYYINITGDIKHTIYTSIKDRCGGIYRYGYIISGPTDAASGYKIIDTRS